MLCWPSSTPSDNAEPTRMKPAPACRSPCLLGVIRHSALHSQPVSPWVWWIEVSDRTGPYRFRTGELPLWFGRSGNRVGLPSCNGSRSFPPRFSHYFLASFAVWLWASAVSRRDQAAGEFGAPFGRSSRLNAQGLRSETSP